MMATTTSPSAAAVVMTPPPINESKPAIIKAAARGDLDAVKRIVEAAASISIVEKNKTMNKAPIWTEIFPVEKNNVIRSSRDGESDNNIQTTTIAQTQEWYDVTATTVAAIRGHHHVLQYLLEEGADPTLKGCPKDVIQDDDDDPFVADQKELHVNAFDVSKDLYKKIRSCRRSHDLLTVCKPYWRRCYYSSSNASKCKRETFTNIPLCELSQLKDVIRRVPPISQYPLKCAYYNESLVDTMPTFAIVGQKRKEPMGVMNQQLQQQQQQLQPLYGGGRLRRCFICNQAKNETSFSKNQKKKGPEATCISCVASASIQVAAEEKAKEAVRPLPQAQLVHVPQHRSLPSVAPFPRQGDIAGRDHQQRLDEGY
mmetsp:Transcript_628/g.818  ORF Transcript_628/g.818 Transcript_628/m.818 type:complete len:370 (-) Transcript_628:14-1123(-)